jgi:hypothetical protein
MTKLAILFDFPHTFPIFATMRNKPESAEEGYMKKTYLTPENRVKDLELEMAFLQSGGLNTGIDPLGDPEDDDPWGNN